jgi:hypothetical protein
MVVKSIDPKQLKVGDEVSLLTNNGRILTGKVSSIAQGDIKIVDCYEYGGQKLSGECSIPLSGVKEARVFTRDILHKEWPDLDFGE